MRNLMIDRRQLHVLTASALLVALTQCAGQTAAETLAMAQAYITDGVDALSAGANVYQAQQAKPDAALTNDIATLQSLAATFAAFTTGNGSAITVANEVLSDINPVATILASVLGPVSLYVPLVVAVIQAFVNGLPAPSTAPATPPAQLHSAAVAYRAAHATERRQLRARGVMLRNGTADGQ